MSKKFIFLASTLILLCGLAGCETVPSPPGVSRELKTICDQYNIQFYLDNVSQVVTLRAAGREAKGLVGSNVIVLENTKIYLSDVLRRERGSIIVPGDFTNKVIQQLIRTGLVHPGFHIVVDPGHGGKDPGTIGRAGTQEKDVTLDIALRLQKALEARGFKVTMTRNRDVFISLEQRTEITTRAKADLFVSIHANSSPSRNTDGLEVYSLRDLEYSEKRDPQRLKNQRLMCQSLSMQSGNSSLEAIITDMLYNYKMSESQLLASYVNKGVSLGARVNSRGVKRAGFHVLRNTLIPSILVEVGFLSNSQEDALLRRGDYRQKMADSISASLVNYAAR